MDFYMKNKLKISLLAKFGLAVLLATTVGNVIIGADASKPAKPKSPKRVALERARARALLQAINSEIKTGFMSELHAELTRFAAMDVTIANVTAHEQTLRAKKALFDRKTAGMLVAAAKLGDEIFEKTNLSIKTTSEKLEAALVAIAKLHAELAVRASGRLEVSDAARVLIKAQVAALAVHVPAPAQIAASDDVGAGGGAGQTSGKRVDRR